MSQELKTKHAAGKYHSFHQVRDHKKKPSMCATKFDHNHNVIYRRQHMSESALFTEDRVAKFNKIEPLVLPTQLPSDSDESDDELSKENATCHKHTRVPLVMSNSV
jgi:hypothetical protein